MKNAGFTLLEVLIALVILSLGLLGLAGLQLRSLRANNDSFARSQAMIMAYGIADRMRVNAQAAADGEYLLDPDNPPAAPAYDCIDSFPGTQGSCGPGEMADADIAAWMDELETPNVLPAGTGRITCDDSVTTDGITCSPSSVHTITVMWDEARTGASGSNCGGDPQVDLQCLTIELAL